MHLSIHFCSVLALVLCTLLCAQGKAVKAYGKLHAAGSLVEGQLGKPTIVGCSEDGSKAMGSYLVGLSNSFPNLIQAATLKCGANQCSELKLTGSSEVSIELCKRNGKFCVKAASKSKCLSKETPVTVPLPIPVGDDVSNVNLLLRTEQDTKTCLEIKAESATGPHPICS